MVLPKYAKIEAERRYLVDRSKLPPLDWGQARVIDDLYLEDSRLRLRSIVSSEDDPVYKLCKKYGADVFGAEPVVNIYLSAQEHALLAVLPGFRIRKRRHRLTYEGVLFGVDRFEEALDGLFLTEIDCDHAVAETLVPPHWAVRDVTSDPFFIGGNLCRVSAAELADRLAEERLLSKV